MGRKGDCWLKASWQLKTRASSMAKLSKPMGSSTGHFELHHHVL
jgi:hypothetical protein